MEDDKLHSKIKSSFDSVEHKAPNDLWNSMSSKLEGEDPAITELATKIKSDFDAVEQGKVPDQVWGNINRQLNIDLVWKRISEQLDRPPVFIWFWRIGLGLLLLVASTIGYFVFNHATESPYSISTSSRVETGADANNSETDLTNKPLPVEENIESVDNHEFGQYEVAVEKATQDGQRKNDASNSGKKLSSTSILTNANSGSLVSNQNSISAGSNISGSSGGNAITNQISEQFDHGEKAAYNPIIPAQKQPDSLNGFKNLYRLSAPATTEHETNEVPVVRLEPLLPQLMDDSLSREILPINSSVALEAVRSSDTNSSKTVKRKPLYLGILGGFNSVQLINNETRISRDPTSLISTMPSFSKNFGLVGFYELNPGSGIMAQIHLYSSINQRYGLYEHGSYFNKEIRLKYQKLALSYQRTLSQRNNYSNQLIIRPGFYLAKLNDVQWTIGNSETFVKDEYNNLDAGFKLDLGKRNRVVKDFSLEYGLNLDYGMLNIFNGNTRESKEYDVSRNRKIGLYLIILKNL